REAVVLEGDELHRVLHQTGTGGEAGSGKIPHARVVLAEASDDMRVIEAGGLDHHVELVRGSEFDVPPGVADELRELRLPRFQVDDLWRDLRKEIRRGLFGGGRGPAHDLGQRL